MATVIALPAGVVGPTALVAVEAQEIDWALTGGVNRFGNQITIKAQARETFACRIVTPQKARIGKPRLLPERTINQKVF